MSVLESIPGRRAAESLGLRFKQEQESDYRRYFLQTYLNQIRLALGLALLIYAIFALLDIRIAGDNLTPMLLVRLGIGCPVIAAAIALTYTKLGQRHYYLLATTTSLAISGTLLAIIAFAPPPANATYYVGLLLVVFYTTTFIRLCCFYATVAAWLPFLAYAALAASVQHLPTWTIFNNCFFLAAGNIIALAAGFFIEIHSRKNFLYQRMLEREMNNTAEANTSLSRELTERADSEQRLKESEGQLRAIFDAVDAALFIHKLDGTIEQVNNKMLEMYEADAADVIGNTPANDPAHIDNPPREQIEAIFRRVAAGEPQRFEWTSILARSGKELQLEVRLQPVTLGGKARVLATAHDISERKRAEKLRHDMEGIARHDLKGPLGLVISLPEILLDENPDLPPHQATLLRRIEDAGYRMLDMINESLDMYRLEQGIYELNPQSVDMAQVARKVLEENEPGARKKNLAMSISIDGEADDGTRGAMLEGEELMLFAMLSNMVRNGVEACPGSGELTLSIDQDEDELCIGVENPGKVPEDMREVFFEKFATSGKKGGTGLGTYSVQLIATVHGGTVLLDEAGPGRTRVLVTLPLSQSRD